MSAKSLETCACCLGSLEVPNLAPAAQCSSPHPTKSPSSLLGEIPLHCGEPHSRGVTSHTLPGPLPWQALTSPSREGVAVAAPLSSLEALLPLSASVSSSPHVYWDLYQLFIN